MRRLGWTVAIALMTALPGCGVAQGLVERATIARTELSLSRVDVTGLDWGALTAPTVGLAFHVQVLNPNMVTARLDRVTYTAYLEGNAVGSGELPTDFAVSPGATGDLVVPLRVAIASLPSPVISALERREAVMRLAGASHMQTPLGTLDVPMDVSRTERF